MSQHKATLHNPYRPPQEDHTEHDSQGGGRRRLFRKRLIPATLLGFISPFIFFGYLVAIGLVLLFNIHDRWIEPELEGLTYFNQQALSPPVVANCIYGLSGSFCGILAGSAWRRGRWQPAASLTISFFLLVALAIHVVS